MTMNEESVKYETNEDGLWRIETGGKSLIEPSNEWIEKTTVIPEPPEPTMEQKIIDLLKERDIVSEKQKLEFDLAIVELWEALLSY